ncbi:galectin-10 isoform X1 [Callithrix jacchus]
MRWTLVRLVSIVQFLSGNEGQSIFSHPYLGQEELKQPHRENTCIITRKASVCPGEKWEGFVGVLCVYPTRRGPAQHTVCFVFSNEPLLQVDFHTTMDELSDIAFHFKVYFGHYVIMNSRENRVWKQEVKLNNMPFEDGKAFELCISAVNNGYQVMVNGQFYYTFENRLPQESVKMLQVWRDISLTSVSVQNQE